MFFGVPMLGCLGRTLLRGLTLRGLARGIARVFLAGLLLRLSRP